MLDKLKECLKYIENDDEYTLKQQLEMVTIPAPSHLEKEKGLYVYKQFKDIGLQDVSIDEVGNVCGSIHSTKGPTIVIAGHLDTVFPIETDLTIKKEGNRYICPGINDDTRAVSELLSLARSIINCKLDIPATIIFLANVCEEGLGDLKGVKYYFKDHKPDYFITIDDGNTGAIIYCATGSIRYKVEFKGKGGHSFGDFGLPNPIHAMSRGISKIADFKTPSNPKTTFNVGVIEGGTSINTISASCSMLLDIRSDSQEELQKYIELARKAIIQGVEEENNRWENEHKVTVNFIEKGLRPAGSQDINSPIIQLCKKANDYLNLETEFRNSGSTDANIPISLNIPAIAIGRGGLEGNVHTIEEWFEPVDSYKAIQRDLILLYLLAIN